VHTSSLYTKKTKEAKDFVAHPPPASSRCFGSLSRRIGALQLGQFLFPLGRLGRLAPGFVELHQPLVRLRNPPRGVEKGSHAGLAPNQSFAALEQERFSFSVFGLAREAGAELAHYLEAKGGIGPMLLDQLRTLAQKRFGFGVFLLGDPNTTQSRHNEQTTRR